MHRAARIAVAVATVAAVGLVLGAEPVAAKTKGKGGGPSVVFLAPDAGAAGAAADEVLSGVTVAAAVAAEGSVADDPFPVEIVREPVPEPGKKLATAFTAWRKAGRALVVAYLPDGRTADVEAAAAKAKLPLLVLSPDPTTPDLDKKRAVFWAGGVPLQDEALQAMDYMLQPIGSRRPAILHDGSERGAYLADACTRLHHVDQTLLGPTVVTDSFGKDDVAVLEKSSADGLTYFGGPEGAERLLAALTAAESELPVLLGQGLASAAVPTFHSGAAEHAWAMEARWFEDLGRTGKEERYHLADAAKAAGRRVLAGEERGHRAMRWVIAALRDAGATDAKKLVPALRALHRPGAAGKPVFEAYGHASLAQLELWHAAPIEVEKLPACHRRPTTRVPIQGIAEVGFFPTSRFAWEPDTHYVHVFWRNDDKRSIEDDLFKIGLWTKGYEANLEQRILDDLLGRVISKLNVLFGRNPDGTSIPGVSYRISFSSEPPPKGVRANRIWNMPIGYDDPVAGGRASGVTAWVFSTYIQRTMYVQHKLEPPLAATDHVHLTGRYRWDASLDENIRNGMVRSLVDGFSQAMALTGAHELGHLAGCGHDTTFPRSIMNVQEGGGLEFDWAEWTPDHVRILEKRLGRVPAAKR